MSKLILHIGSHKTGSTSIQRFLINNEKALRKNGWQLLDNNNKFNEIAKGSINDIVSFSEHKSSFRPYINDQYQKTFNKKFNKNIIASCEELFWFDDINGLSKLANCLNNIFTDVKIVIYLRNPIEMIKSHFLQGFKSQDSSARAFYGDDFSGFPSYEDAHIARYYEYKNKVNLWQELFGKNSVIVRDYSEISSQGGDVVTDFSNSILKMNFGQSPTKERENLTLNCNEIFLRKYINRLNKIEEYYYDYLLKWNSVSGSNYVFDVEQYKRISFLLNDADFYFDYDLNRKSNHYNISNPDEDKVLLYLLNLLSNVSFKRKLLFKVKAFLKYTTKRFK